MCFTTTDLPNSRSRKVNEGGCGLSPISGVGSLRSAILCINLIKVQEFKGLQKKWRGQGHPQIPHFDSHTFSVLAETGYEGWGDHIIL